MKKLYMARNEVDAHFAKGLLDEQGIESVVQGGALSNVLGAIPMTEETLPSLWVKDEDFDRAEEAIAGLKIGAQRAEIVGDAWKCPSCGEMIEPQFTECWKCGAARPEKKG